MKALQIMQFVTRRFVIAIAMMTIAGYALAQDPTYVAQIH